MSGVDIEGWSLTGMCVWFVACSVGIGFAGTKLAGIADKLADRAELGEALVGGLLLGGATSLAGSVLSVSAAIRGLPDLALSNAIGGIGAQTVFIAIADLSYRKANLEHAAASAENIVQGSVLVCVLSILLLSSYSPDWTIYGIHPGTPILLLTYGYGMRLTRQCKEKPMWEPIQTDQTQTDDPDSDNKRLSLTRLWASFAALGLALALAGWQLQKAAAGIVDATGMDMAIMGMLFTSVATSLPELVTTLAAVRRGALTLAMSGIVGGNAYDTLFVAFSDVGYREGSIFHTMDQTHYFWIVVGLLMTGILIMGMLLRERRGVGNIGFESLSILVLYGLAVASLFAK